MNPLSPQQVVGGLNRHESGSFTWIYSAYFVDVIHIARGLIGSSPDVEDLAQESFLKLLQHGGHFESLEKVRHFLNNSTRNSCLDYLRHREVMNSGLEAIVQHYGSDTARSPAAVETISGLVGLLYQAIEKLPPQSKQVFLLWYWDKLSNAEISKRLDLSEKTVANHKTHASKYLRAEILKNGLYLWILFLLKFLK